MTEFLHPEDRELVLQHHLARLRGEYSPQEYSFRIVNGAGETRWVMFHVSLVDWEGAPATFSLLSDITEQMKAEQRLEESERRFREVMHAAEDAVFLLDGIRILDGNAAAARMFGFGSREELLQSRATPASLSPPVQPDGRPSAEKAAEMIRLAFERGFHHFEWVHRRLNGEEFPALISLTLTAYEGRPAIYAVGRDISERKRLEEERRKKEQLL